MAADLQEQAVQVEWKAAKITAAALKGLIEQILANRGKITHGEQSLKKLNLQGKKLESIELTGEDMQAFKRELNKYAVDFSIKKDTETQNYTVFFKGQDVDRVYKGLQKCVENFQKGSKKPIKEVMKEAEEKAAQRNAERKSKYAWIFEKETGSAGTGKQLTRKERKEARQIREAVVFAVTEKGRKRKRKEALREIKAARQEYRTIKRRAEKAAKESRRAEKHRPADKV